MQDKDEKKTAKGLDAEQLAHLETLLAGEGNEGAPQAANVLDRFSRYWANREKDEARLKEMKTIDRFELKAQLGHGAFGTVYQAVDTTTGISCALKIASIDDRKRANSLQRESEALASVNHPGIIKVFGHGRDQETGLCWVAIELVVGESIASKIESRRDESKQEDQFLSFDPEDNKSRKGKAKGKIRALSRDDLLRYVEWFRQGASALSAMEDAELVHRDIKPQNLMVANDGGLHLIDFGLSFDLSGSDVRGILAGTLPYMSPEQTQTGFAGHDGRSDIYSLAVSFWELLTGVRAVQRGASRSGLLLQIVHDPIPPVSKGHGVPASLNPIFDRALQKDVRLRYQQANELEKDLDAWLRDAALIHAEERLIEKTVRQTRKHPILASFAFIAILTLLVWGTWRTVSTRQHRASILAQARSIVDEGRWTEFSPFFAKNAAMFDGDPAFLAMYRGAMPNVSGEMIDEMFAQQGVVVEQLAHTSSHRKKKSEIAVHLKYCPSPELLGMAAFAEVMDGNFKGALQVIENNQGIKRNNLITEIQLLCHIGVRDHQSFRKLLGEINPQESPTTQSLCIRAYRHFQQDFLSRTEQIELQSDERSSVFWQPVRRSEFESLRRDLVATSQQNPRHRMLRFFLAIVEHQLGRPELAYPIFESLRLDSNSESDKAGTQFLQARSLIFAAHKAQNNSDAMMNQAAQLACNAFEMAPGLAERMSIWLTDLRGFPAGRQPATAALRDQFIENDLVKPWRTIHQWLTSIMEYPWPPEVKPIFGEATTYLASVAVFGASTENEDEMVLDLSETFLGWFGDSEIPELEGREDVQNFTLIVIWTYLHRGKDIVNRESNWNDKNPKLMTCAQRAAQNVQRALRRSQDESPSIEILAAQHLSEAYRVLALGMGKAGNSEIKAAKSGLSLAIRAAKDKMAAEELDPGYVESITGLIQMCEAALKQFEGLGEEN